MAIFGPQWPLFSKKMPIFRPIWPLMYPKYKNQSRYATWGGAGGKWGFWGGGPVKKSAKLDENCGHSTKKKPPKIGFKDQNSGCILTKKTF